MRYIVLLAIFGLLLGLGLSQARNAGYLERWQRAELPPVGIVELVTSGQGTVLARMASGEVYRCTTWRQECWVPSQLPSEAAISGFSYPTTVTKPCDFSSPEFSLFANPPKGILDCIQDETIYADGWGENTYVLDSNGIVWEWSHGGTVYSAGGGDVFCSCLGLLLGLALGGSMMWWKQRRRIPIHGE